MAVVLSTLELLAVSGDRVALGVSTAVFFLGLGAGLGACAWGLYRCGSWARGPVVAAQLMGLLLSFSFWGGETKAVAVVLLIVSLATLVGVLHPASIKALSADLVDPD